MKRKWNASRNHFRTELWKFSMLSYWHIPHRNSSLLTSSHLQWDSPVWSRSLKPQFIYSHSLFSRIVLCKWVSSPPTCFFIRLLPYRSVLLSQWNPFPGTLVHMDTTVMTFIPVLLYSPAVLLLILSFYHYICYACDVNDVWSCWWWLDCLNLCPLFLWAVLLVHFLIISLHLLPLVALLPPLTPYTIFKPFLQQY